MDLSQEQVKALAKRQRSESLEIELLQAWSDGYGKQLGPLERQYRHNHKRKWKWDFKIGDVLVDVQGGTFIRGGHSRGIGQDKDYEKWNDAVLMGYRPLLFGTQAMKDPDACAEMIAIVLTRAKEIPECTGSSSISPPT